MNAVTGPSFQPNNSTRTELCCYTLLWVHFLFFSFPFLFRLVVYGSEILSVVVLPSCVVFCLSFLPFVWFLCVHLCPVSESALVYIVCVPAACLCPFICSHVPSPVICFWLSSPCLYFAFWFVLFDLVLDFLFIKSLPFLQHLSACVWSLGPFLCTSTNTWFSLRKQALVKKLQAGERLTSPICLFWVSKLWHNKNTISQFQ